MKLWSRHPIGVSGLSLTAPPLQTEAGRATHADAVASTTSEITTREGQDMHASDTITLSTASIGPDAPVFTIAEMSGNHNGDLDRALAIVDAVASTGAHALKIQTYTADTLTIDSDAPAFRVTASTVSGVGAISTRCTKRLTRRGSGTRPSSVVHESTGSFPSRRRSTRRRSPSSKTWESSSTRRHRPRSSTFR